MNEIPQQELKEFARIADLFTKKKYNLNVLKDDQEYPLLTKVIEDHFKNSEQRKTLLLPELGHQNESVAVFSDYGGESKDSNYYTYSFLICAWQQTGMFLNVMTEIRKKHKLEDKEISFKDFRYGPIKRGLDDYLSALNLVPGLLFTVVIEKKVGTLFSKDKADAKNIAVEMKQHGLGEWKLAVIEKLLCTCHVAAYLVSLLSEKEQKIFWMSDNDSIAANETAANHWQKIFCNILNYYSDHDFSLIGGVLPFKEKNTNTLDLLSSCDIVAGSIEHYYTRMSKNIEDLKEEADKVLRWLCFDGLMLKKHAVILKKGEGKNIIAGSIKFELKETDMNKTPIKIIRP